MKKILVAFPLLLASCARNPQASLQPALDTINGESLLSEIKTLSSDDFEGRKPGSAGEQKTIAYMQGQFQQMGLKPGNPDGTYLQSVPLAGINSKSQPDVEVKGRKLALVDKRDYIALSSRYVPEVTVARSDIVSSVMALWRRNTAGTITRASTSRARPSSCWSTILHPRSPGSLQARPRHVQGRGHDLLRAMDLQVRDRLAERRRRGHHYPRNRPGWISFRGGCR